jgi:ABC-type branched-subunit amino acid transport system permease subunit
VNTTAVVAAGAAAAAASQEEEPESTPWGWVAFGILAAGVVGVAVFWLVRRRHDKKPSVS